MRLASIILGIYELRVDLSGTCSVCLVDEERDLALLKREENEAVLLVHGVAAEGLAKEYVPVGLPFLVHMLLNNLSDLKNNLLVSIKNLVRE